MGVSLLEIVIMQWSLIKLGSNGTGEVYFYPDIDKQPQYAVQYDCYAANLSYLADIIKLMERCNVRVVIKADINCQRSLLILGSYDYWFSWGRSFVN